MSGASNLAYEPDMEPSERELALFLREAPAPRYSAGSSPRAASTGPRRA